jgi:methanogenic corrinoid protein MtbC1
MNPQARQRSILLENMSKAIAKWTVGEYAALDDTLTQRYGESWRSLWLGDVQQRIRLLAQALAVESEVLFAHSVRWTRLGFTNRGVPVQDLANNLGCMKRVIEEHVPPPVADLAGKYIRVAMNELQADPHPELDGAAANSDHRELQLLFMEAALTGRRREAEAMVIKEMDSGRSVNDLFHNLLQPFLKEVGRMWHADEITVADEHAATAIAESAMSAMRSKIKTAIPNNLKVVATAIAGEQHALGVRMVADLFEIGGWEVLYLGPNMPHDHIIYALQAHQAHLLAASVSSLLNLRALGDLIDLVRAQPELATVKILVGGQPLTYDPSVWSRLGADGCAMTAREAVDLGHQLVTAD